MERAADAAVLIGFAAEGADDLAKLAGEVGTLSGIATKDGLEIRVLRLIGGGLESLTSIFAGFDEVIEEVDGFRGFGFHVV